VRVLQARGETASLARLVQCLDRTTLELLAREAPEQSAQATFAYLDSLDARQTRDLGGVRDRLAVLAESDAARWLAPSADPASPDLDLLEAMRNGAVVYFALEADRRPLLAQMLGAAIVQDLITVVASCQSQPLHAVVAIDEFAAVAAEQVARLFGRARSAGISLLLATQELADLRAGGRGVLLDQVLGNVGTLIAHRQVVPDSASLIATLAGTRGAWTGTLRPDGEVSRTRTRELELRPDEIRGLAPGQAAVVVPGSGVAPIARILFPGEPS
jgi:type IV secretory pathway TraG/TraD family ATPase VirD4